MNEETKLKSAALAWGGRMKIAIVGASTLKGRELKEVLEQSEFAAAEIKLLDDEALVGTLDAIADEATVILAANPDSFHGIDIVFFAGDAAFTTTHLPAAREAGCSIVDMSYSAAAEDAAMVRAPWIEQESGARIPDLAATAVTAAHPAAIVIAMVLGRLRRAGDLTFSVITVFEPVSEQGKRGMDELHQQTLNLLSFQTMPRDVYDQQVAFNLVNRLGQEAKTSLQKLNRKIASHVSAIAGERFAIPALQVVQAPTFHSHVLSFYLEAPEEWDEATVSSALDGPHVQLIGEGDEAPNNVNVAGQENILLTIEKDETRGRGFWIWAAADNLRLAALNAVECASALAATRPTGKVQ